MRHILIVLFLTAPATAQNTRPGLITSPPSPTRARASQVKDPPVPAASVRIVMPDGTAIYAQIDMSSFVLDTTTTPPTLRVKTATPATSEYIQIYRNADGTFTLPEGAVQVVYRNGLLQLAGHDYTISGTLLRFHDNCCEADENVTVKVKR